MAKFDMMCNFFGIIHQFTASQWPHCNGMVERMTKTLKHGLTIVSTRNILSWDLQIPRILFGCHCGIKANTIYSPYMIMTNRTPRLTIDNRLSSLTHIMEGRIVHEEMSLHMVSKMKLVVQLHESLLQNVDQTQKKHKRTYAARKGWVWFHFFEDGKVLIKMRKPGKKKSLLASWEGPYMFANYKDGRGCRT
jgi:hypothetical protein